MLLTIELRGLVPVIHITENNRKNAGHCLIQHRFLYLALLHCLHDHTVVDPAGIRHFQILSGHQPFDPLVTGAPVRHQKSVESPLFPEYVRQQPAALGYVLAVYPVVGTHHCPRLPFPDCSLEGSQVQLPKRPLTHLRRHRGAAFFLIVDREVLHARSHVLRLQAAYVRRRKLRRQIGIFRKIFKVPPA